MKRFLQIRTRAGRRISLPAPPAEDERGDTLGTVIIFPVVLLLILLILQMWFWSSARTRTRIAADQAIRSAQDVIVDTTDENNIDDGIDSGVSRGLDWLSRSGNFLKNPGYVECIDKSGEPGDQSKSQSLVPQGTDACANPQDNALIDVRVDTTDKLIEVNVNGQVSTLIGNFSFPERGLIGASACGLANARTATDRAAVNLVETVDGVEQWNDTLTC